MPTLHSHTHCQAAPANAWQRVCLLQRTTKTTDKTTDEKEARLRTHHLYTSGGLVLRRTGNG
jgi:hypothetical protein